MDEDISLSFYAHLLRLNHVQTHRLSDRDRDRESNSHLWAIVSIYNSGSEETLRLITEICMYVCSYVCTYVRKWLGMRAGKRRQRKKKDERMVWVSQTILMLSGTPRDKGGKEKKIPFQNHFVRRDPRSKILVDWLKNRFFHFWLTMIWIIDRFVYLQFFLSISVKRVCCGRSIFYTT